MLEKLDTILNFSVDIQELTDYYNTISAQFQYLKWDYNIGKDSITDEWKERLSRSPRTMLPYGWAIQSNLENINEPCPPHNITNHKRVEYRNTSMAFGIIQRLQKRIPYAYRYAISVLPPTATVELHSDQEDELTVWIPIHSNDSAGITFVVDDVEIPIITPANGKAILFNTVVPHYTMNNGNTDRVALMFRFNNRYLDDLMDVIVI